MTVLNLVYVIDNSEVTMTIMVQLTLNRLLERLFRIICNNEIFIYIIAAEPNTSVSRCKEIQFMLNVGHIDSKSFILLLLPNKSNLIRPEYFDSKKFS